MNHKTIFHKKNQLHGRYVYVVAKAPPHQYMSNGHTQQNGTLYKKKDDFFVLKARCTHYTHIQFEYEQQIFSFTLACTLHIYHEYEKGHKYHFKNSISCVLFISFLEMMLLPFFQRQIWFCGLFHTTTARLVISLYHDWQLGSILLRCIINLQLHQSQQKQKQLTGYFCISPIQSSNAQRLVSDFLSVIHKANDLEIQKPQLLRGNTIAFHHYSKIMENILTHT